MRGSASPEVIAAAIDPRLPSPSMSDSGTDNGGTERAGYIKAYRAEHPAYVERERKAAAARLEAFRGLAKMYPREFAALLAQARIARGLPAEPQRRIR
jgi:hypothetical protein